MFRGSLLKKKEGGETQKAEFSQPWSDWSLLFRVQGMWNTYWHGQEPSENGRSSLITGVNAINPDFPWAACEKCSLLPKKRLQKGILAPGRKTTKETLPKSSSSLGLERRNAGKTPRSSEQFPKFWALGDAWKEWERKGKNREGGKEKFSSQNGTEFPELVAPTGISLHADFGAAHIPAGNDPPHLIQA